MPSLKDLKNRIGSVKNTRKITKAMQMVAAAKLRRAQDAVVLALGVDDLPRRLLGRRRGSTRDAEKLPPVTVLQIMAPDRDGDVFAAPVEWQGRGPAPRLFQILPARWW